MLTDTHAHLHFDRFEEDLPRVIERAKENKVVRILTLGTDLKSSGETLKIAKANAPVFAAAGIHPTDAISASPADFQEIRKMATNEEKIVAIGEIGLDLFWKDVPLKNQIPVFEKMLEIAGELNLPVVIHNRDAQKEMQDFFRKLKVEHVNGVMHSFSGSISDAEFYLNLGMFISFTGVITFKNFKELDVVREVKPESLLLETDSPFLAPVPNRGKRNEPAFIKFTAEKLSQIHEIDYEILLAVCRNNANKLFRWE